MSLETTLACAEATAARAAWNRHRHACADCTAGAKRRDRAGMCGTGIHLHVMLRVAVGELDRQKELDEAPIDGQGELFPASSVH